MKILHTSDWHLGASLGPEKRTREFKAVLAWLVRILAEQKIEAIIIAGDIFDSGIPPNSAAELFFQFLSDAREAGVRTVIATAGNHDSASFLEAPKSILKAMHVSVIGKASPDGDEQIIPLSNSDGKIEAVVCAVPFLRDRDIRKAVSGENAREQQNSRREGILRHYRTVCSRAAELYPGTPLIVTGHFYATGGTVSGGNTVGTLANIAVTDLPQDIDYLALGHLHIPQCVGGRQNCRYSGSLLQLNFSDGDTGKSVLVVDTGHLSDPPQEIPVPVFQKMEKIVGDIDFIRKRLAELASGKESVWASVENTGSFEPLLPQITASFCGESPVRIISCRNLAENPAVCRRHVLGGKKLDELTPERVFLCLLDERQIEPERREALLQAFREAAETFADADSKAE